MKKITGVTKVPFKVLGAVFAADEAKLVHESYTPPEVEFSSYLKSEKKDFLKVDARHISAGIVRAGDRVLDFSEEVLLASVPLFTGLHLYVDHYTEGSKSLGYIESGRWSPAQFINNQLFPAGIDAVIAVDTLAVVEIDGGSYDGKKIFKGADIARQLSYPVPGKLSVQVEYEYESSHAFEDEWDFYRAMRNGLEKDGELVRMVVTKITRYLESSYVWQGVIPTAQTKMGVLTDPKTEDKFQIFTEAESVFSTNRLVGLGSSSFGLSALSNQDLPPNDETEATEEEAAEDVLENVEIEQKTETKKEKTQAGHSVSVEMKVVLTELGEAKLKLKDQANTIATLTAELSSEKEKAALAQSQIEVALAAETEAKTELSLLRVTNESLVAFAEKEISKKRETLVASYRLLMGDKSKEEVIDSFGKITDLSEIDALLLRYTKESEEAFAHKCPKCQTVIAAFSSVVPTEDTKSKALVVGTRNLEDYIFNED